MIATEKGQKYSRKNRKYYKKITGSKGVKIGDEWIVCYVETEFTISTNETTATLSSSFIIIIFRIIKQKQGPKLRIIRPCQGCINVNHYSVHFNFALSCALIRLAFSNRKARDHNIWLPCNFIAKVWAQHRSFNVQQWYKTEAQKGQIFHVISPRKVSPELRIHQRKKRHHAWREAQVYNLFGTTTRVGMRVLSWHARTLVQRQLKTCTRVHWIKALNLTTEVLTNASSFVEE